MMFDDFPGLVVLDELARRYSAGGFQFAVTGGAVRDYLMRRSPNDFDVTSDAGTWDSERILAEYGDHVSLSGNGFGVVSAAVRGMKIQVLPFHTPADRLSSYDRAKLSGDRLVDQLACADITLNAAALILPERRWIDPFGAADDVARRVLRPPIDPHDAIACHPPTMLRYARFAAEFGFVVDPAVKAAMTDLAPTIAQHTDWGVVVTLSKILMSPHPTAGVELLYETSLIDHLPAAWRQRLAEVRGVPGDAV